MAIKDLKAREGKVDIVVEVTEKQESREFQKFGSPGKVCNAKIKDDTGEITLTLWNEDIEKVKVGDKVHIKNGYVGEWQGELQLSTGRYGELEIVGAGEGTNNETESSDDVKTESVEKVEEEVIDSVQEEKIE